MVNVEGIAPQAQVMDREPAPATSFEQFLKQRDLAALKKAPLRVPMAEDFSDRVRKEIAASIDDGRAEVPAVCCAACFPVKVQAAKDAVSSVFSDEHADAAHKFAMQNSSALIDGEHLHVKLALPVHKFDRSRWSKTDLAKLQLYGRPAIYPGATYLAMLSTEFTIPLESIGDVTEGWYNEGLTTGCRRFSVGNKSGGYVDAPMAEGADPQTSTPVQNLTGKFKLTLTPPHTVYTVENIYDTYNMKTLTAMHNVPLSRMPVQHHVKADVPPLHIVPVENASTEVREMFPDIFLAAEDSDCMMLKKGVYHHSGLEHDIDFAYTCDEIVFLDNKAAAEAIKLAAKLKQDADVFDCCKDGGHVEHV